MTMIKTSDLSDDGFDIVHPAEVASVSVSPLLDESAATQSSNHEYSPHPLDHTMEQLEDLSLGSQKDLHGLLVSDEYGSKNGNSITDRLSKLSSTLMSHMDWSNKVILIAVMGMTGSGKTTFISQVTGNKDLKIGHDLTSCTQGIQVIETKIDGHIVRFVDTPGFSDTYLSDTDVLTMIAEYLEAAYTQNIKLSGIIYLHPISDIRVTHHATKNLEMFRKLTGEDNLKNVVLATTMWDKVTPGEGDKRELQLKQKFWKLLLAFDAKSARYYGTADSALDIARGFIKNKPFYLQLQQEMGKDNKLLRDTAAGREIMAELERMKETHQSEIDAMREMIAQTSAKENEAAMLQLKEHYEEMLGEMKKIIDDERRMNQDAIRSLTEKVRNLENNRGGCTMM